MSVLRDEVQSYEAEVKRLTEALQLAGGKA
jgi:hypothetical protein